MNKKHHDDQLLHAASLVADYQTQHITTATHRILENADNLRFLAEKWKNVDPKITQGRMFEQLETTKFNYDALVKNSNLHAATTDSLGSPHHPADVFIKNENKILREYQLKSSEKAASSAFLLSDEKYSEMARLAPKEQYEKIKELLQKRVATGTLKAADYEQTLRNLEEDLNYKGIHSGGTTYAEALEATEKNKADQIASKFEIKAKFREAHQSGLEAGKIGAGLAGGLSGINGLLKLARGEAGTGEVIAQVAVDSAKGYATSYITTAMSKGISHAAQEGFGKAAGGALTKASAHIALAAGVVQSGKSLISYLNGEIEDEQLLSEISQTAITGASAFYYGALGQLIIPVPVLGAFIGSTIGYFVGNMLHQSGLISLGEVGIVKAARERRERVQAMCMTAIPLLRAHRLELDGLLAAHFAERSYLLTTAFDDLENSLTDLDANQFTASLERINNAFGAALPFKTFDEFDKFMLDDNQTFVL